LDKKAVVLLILLPPSRFQEHHLSARLIGRSRSDPAHRLVAVARGRGCAKGSDDAGELADGDTDAEQDGDGCVDDEAAGNGT
jgi:hypothetical protein